MSNRDVTAGATGATAVAPKFSGTLTLFQPGGQILHQHRRGRTKNFPTVISLGYIPVRKPQCDFFNQTERALFLYS